MTQEIGRQKGCLGEGGMMKKSVAEAQKKAEGYPFREILIEA
jgi:hypothetical protein